MGEVRDELPEAWRENFDRHTRGARRFRSVMRTIPSEPRCKLCYAPFSGVGARFLRFSGYRPSRKNPNICDVCLEKGPEGGFETEGGVLFADVRGYTALTERSSLGEIAGLMERYYRTAYRILVEHDAVVDKFVGDEAMAVFWPPLLGGDPMDTMISAAEKLLGAVGYGSAEDPWLRVGVGMDFGPVYLGNIGTPGAADFTALGDVVNTAARLQAEAEAGQIVLTDRIYEQLRDRYPEARPAAFEVKGKAAPVAAHVIELAVPAAA